MFSIFKKNQTQSPKPLPWHRVSLHYYFLNQACLALEEIGFFDVLIGKKMNIEELSRILSVNKSLLEVTIKFLWSVTDFLEYDGKLYSLKDNNFFKVFYVAKAYKPVFNNLSSLLKQEKVYGRDVLRDGYYLQKASVLFSNDAVRLALAALENEKSGQLIDFGCGAAHSLIDYCRHDNARTSLGIDIDSNIARAAGKNVEEAGLRDKIVIVESDALNFEKWQPFVHKGQPQYFLASTMLHEFLRDGEEFVVDFLAKIKAGFPDSQFFIIEFDALPFEKIKTETDLERKLFAAMYELWHPLTNQGMPQPREVWEKIIQKSGWKIKNISRADMNLLIYHCE